MSSRFGPSALHQRDARSSLFENYAGDRRSSRPASQSPARAGSSLGVGGGPYGGYASSANGSGSGNLGVNMNMNGSGGASSSGSGSGGVGFRPATPNRKGQYSDSVLSELESQNDDQVEGMSARVKMLKDITVAIGDEIRDSSKLAERMNDGFDNTRVRLRGTMNRMLRMAERSGVPWKVWLAFFAAVTLLFCYVWLF